MKVELGGGSFARGDGWINVDQCDNADVKHDLNIAPWPFDDESVDEIYSSHCIEHVDDPAVFLNECARIGKIGCKIEIRCPAPTAHLAYVAGHKHVFSLQNARNIDIHFPHLFWKGKRRPLLKAFHLNPSEMLDWAKRDLPFLKGLSDQQIMFWIPGTAHENVFEYEVVENGVVQ